MFVSVFWLLSILAGFKFRIQSKCNLFILLLSATANTFLHSLRTNVFILYKTKKRAPLERGAWQKWNIKVFSFVSLLLLLLMYCLWYLVLFNTKGMFLCCMRARCVRWYENARSSSSASLAPVLLHNIVITATQHKSVYKPCFSKFCSYCFVLIVCYK